MTGSSARRAGRLARADFDAYAEKAAREMSRGRGVRLGESTVASRRVHLIQPTQPQVVTVASNSDAGGVFYGRPVPDEVVHLDIFHEVCEVDHFRVAKAVMSAALEFAVNEGWEVARSCGFATPTDLLDVFDVQTATGGGRVTGSLLYGNRESLRKAHATHVHVACLVPPALTALLFYVVDAAEREVMRQGFELRRIEVLRNVCSREGSSQDLSPYQAYSDSRLRGSTLGQPQGYAGQGRMGRRATGASGSSGAPGGDEAVDAGEADEGEVGISETNGLPMEVACELAREFGGRHNLARLLAALEASQSQPFAAQAQGADLSDVEDLASMMSERKLVTCDRRRFAYTRLGLAVKAALRLRAAEIDAACRRMARRILPPGKRPRRLSPATLHGMETPEARGQGFGRRKKVCYLDHKASLGLAAAETVVAAAARSIVEGSVFTLKRGDLRVFEPRRRFGPDVCLILDASASMAGRRMRAAKHLARELSLICRGRVAVLTFQERDVRTVVALTRSKRQIEAGLARIRPEGLTPLAAGLMGGLETARRATTRGIIMVLLTDGIPTMNRWTTDPARDALRAALEVARVKAKLVCIGLAPNRDFLARLAAAAHGSLYVLDEFDRDSLVAVVSQEGAAGRHPAGGARE